MIEIIAGGGYFDFVDIILKNHDFIKKEKIKVESDTTTNITEGILDI